MYTPLKSDSFWAILKNNLGIYNYKYKYLLIAIDSINSGHKIIYESSFIIHSSNYNSWILIIHSDILYIYGKNWNKVLVNELTQKIDLKLYKNYEIMGTEELIYDLLNFYNIHSFNIEKERVFYEAVSVHNFLTNNIRPAMSNDLPILSKMMQDYYHEEYKGKNDKSIEEMNFRIVNEIINKEIYIINADKENIASFCTIIDPDIGILFTNIKYRNQGYGKKILSYCSNLLIDKNKKVFLMTDKKNVESNILCKNIGFYEIYKHTYILINVDR